MRRAARRLPIVVLLSLLVSLAASTAVTAQRGRQGGPPIPQEPVTMPLWDGPAPGAQGTEPADVPTLTMYMPRNTAGPLTAVVLAPGGGYVALASNHEGRQVANFFNSLGVATFVLKYRLGPKYHHPVELGDIQRAIRIVRSRAAEWHIAPDRIGVMGFSAGGHLASTASTHFDAGNAAATDPIDRAGSRPDFSILGYPVITMTESWMHRGSRNNLLGNDPDPQLAASLSNDTQVTADTPPTFLFHTYADTTVPVENSVAYFMALRKAGVPAEMHIFEDGPHGVGLALENPILGEWPTLLANWLRARGLIE